MINILYQIYNKKIGFSIQKIDIGTQKIDGCIMVMFDMMIAAFLVNNKDRKVKFFEKNFLLANISLNVVFKIFFFCLSNAEIRFLGQ